MQQPLQRIFDSPIQLLKKTERDKDVLLGALESGDPHRIANAVFDFSVGAYHLVDWVKALHPELEGDVYALLESNPNIGACRDLCNACKHVFLDIERHSYKTHPPKISEVGESVVPNTFVASAPRTVLKVQFQNGDRRLVKDVAINACEVWQGFFNRHGLSK